MFRGSTEVRGPTSDPNVSLFKDSLKIRTSGRSAGRSYFPRTLPFFFSEKPRPPREFTEEQKAEMDKILAELGVNAYGDPIGTNYFGGTPLFDESRGQFAIDGLGRRETYYSKAAALIKRRLGYDLFPEQCFPKRCFPELYFPKECSWWNFQQLLKSLWFF